MKFEDKVIEFDKDSEEYEALFGSRYGSPDSSTKEVLVDVLHAALNEGESID